MSEGIESKVEHGERVFFRRPNSIMNCDPVARDAAVWSYSNVVRVDPHSVLPLGHGLKKAGPHLGGRDVVERILQGTIDLAAKGHVPKNARLAAHVPYDDVAETLTYGSFIKDQVPVRSIERGLIDVDSKRSFSRRAWSDVLN